MTATFSLIIMLSGSIFLGGDAYTSVEQCDAAAAAIQATLKDGVEIDHTCVDTEELVQSLRGGDPT